MASADARKEQVLALQQEILEASGSPKAQRRVREGLSGVEVEKELREELAVKHGLPKGKDLQKLFDDLKDDPDVYVNAESIRAALEAAQPAKEKDAAMPPGSSKNKQGMIRLLKSLLSSFSEPDFQKEVERLKKSAGKDLADQGFYQLPGRVELAFAIQEQLLPCFGFEASKSGVTDMIGQCAAYLEDPEVAQLFDSVNAKLGMSPSACAKFREKAKLMLP